MLEEIEAKNYRNGPDRPNPGSFAVHNKKFIKMKKERKIIHSGWTSLSG